MTVNPVRETRGGSRWILKPLAAGLSLGAIYTAVLAIPLDAAGGLGLGNGLTSSWIMVIYGWASLLAIVMSLRYRQPLVVTGNIFVLIFVKALGGRIPWNELVGATMLAGAIVLILGLTGLTDRVAAVLPAPVVYGVLAGVVLPLLAETFTELGVSTLLVGSTLAAYLLSRAFLGDRIPALLTALVVGVIVAVVSSEAGSFPSPDVPQLTLTLPVFSLQAILTATPVIVVFIALQANAPSIVFLRSQGYDPPERGMSLVSGAGTVLGSVFGPMGVSLSLPATALTAGPDAGQRNVRYWAGIVASGIGLLIAATSGSAARLIEFVPAALLIAVVGVAVLGILARALQEMTKGPLLLGPVVAFATASSGIELAGLGAAFWALAFGVAVSLLLERKGWRQIHRSDRLAA